MDFLIKITPELNVRECVLRKLCEEASALNHLALQLRCADTLRLHKDKHRDVSLTIPFD